MAYQINGSGKIRDWLTEERDPECRQAMLDWLPRLAADPAGVATAERPREGIPVFVAAVPHTYAFVDYSVVEQFKTVLILRVVNTTLEDFLRSLPPAPK